eukprot:4008262-Amphidinium_carterae.2
MRLQNYGFRMQRIWERTKVSWYPTFWYLYITPLYQRTNDFPNRTTVQRLLAILDQTNQKLNSEPHGS